MKIVCIADLQGMCTQIKPEMLPEGDMLIIAGDLCSWGNTAELIKFNDWLGKLDYKHKIVVGGNHDQCLTDLDGHKFISNGTYLQDELIEVEGLRIYGTPGSEMNELRLNYSWAFCEPGYLMRSAESIPKNLDILIAHGPVYGILDKTVFGKHVGNKYMRQAVIEKKPRYFISGHIHESYGIEQFNDTTFINAAVCNERNELFYNKDLYHDPIVIDL